MLEIRAETAVSWRDEAPSAAGAVMGALAAKPARNEPTPAAPIDRAQVATLVLCAGTRSYAAVPIAVGSSNAMVPINGRPVIAWVLEELIRQGVTAATLVVRADDADLAPFVRHVFGGRLALRLVPAAAHGGSIVASLQAGLAANPGAQQVRVLLGDTLVSDPVDAAETFVYAGEVPHPERWCVVRADSEDRIASLHDKEPLAGDQHLALAGYYRFGDTAALSRAVRQTLATPHPEMSALLRAYAAHDVAPEVRRTDRWHDFGNIDNLARAKLDLLQPREFNRVQINRSVHAITKRSADRSKINNEAAWFSQLPPDLALLAPRLTARGEDADGAWYTLEYYGYPTLTELLVCGRLLPEVWDSILRRVLDVHALFASKRGLVAVDAAHRMYGVKTRQRADQLRAQHRDWAFLDADTITLNGRTIGGPARVMARIAPWVQHLAATMTGSVCHGDLCFSNILYDVGAQIVRVIDPRGSFGGPGIYGDPRYDLAKLRHSACGWYDFIVAGYVETAQLGPTDFTLTWLVPPATRRIATYFDAQLVERGYDLSEIKLIEALLFLSMAPLHADVPSRQLVMTLHGLALLDEAIGDRAPPALLP